MSSVYKWIIGTTSELQCQQISSCLIKLILEFACKSLDQFFKEKVSYIENRIAFVTDEKKQRCVYENMLMVDTHDTKHEIAINMRCIAMKTNDAGMYYAAQIIHALCENEKVEIDKKEKELMIIQRQEYLPKCLESHLTKQVLQILQNILMHFKRNESTFMLFSKNSDAIKQVSNMMTIAKIGWSRSNCNWIEIDL